ncbi:MAG: beta-ketoacyl-ACP synthase II [Planctomycetes bacterium]|nr:beta-ketoacyl-ACP synthase II [Planctomycetota bacterium]
MNRRRVVITGLGAVTPLGLDLASTWDALLAGRSSAKSISRFDVSRHSSRFACLIDDFDPLKYFAKPEARKMDPYTQFMMVSADEAMKASGLEIAKEDPTRAGCILGTGIGGIQELEATKEIFLERGPDRVSPFFIPKMMVNALAGQAAIRYGLQGTCFATSSACASASHAIGMALRAIQWDEADIMLTGGSEAATTALSLAGFCSLRALSERNDAPARASRPFDKDRDGFVMGEGAGALVLEELEHARRRGAPILAELIGYGSTDDAYHITAPDEGAGGASRAIAAALRDGQVAFERVGYVNAHGTSTPLNDRIETLALKKVLGEHARRVPVSSTKSMTGHLLGASGAIELVFTVQSILRGAIPPTINYETPDPDCDLDYVPNVAREASIDVAFSNSLGFGGHNTALAVARFRG